MLPKHALASIFALFYVTFAGGTDVVVDLNSTRLVTNPPNIWTDDYYGSACPVRWLNVTGESVSLTFNGTSAKVVLLQDRVGRIAQIALDGQNMTQLNTFGNGVLVLAGVCIPVPWTSPELSLTQHTLTITALDTNPVIEGIVPWLDFSNFVYDDGTAQPSATLSSNPSSSAGTSNGSATSTGSSKTGVIVGAVLGAAIFLVLLVLGGLFLRRRRTPPVIDLSADPFPIAQETAELHDPDANSRPSLGPLTSTEGRPRKSVTGPVDASAPRLSSPSPPSASSSSKRPPTSSTEPSHTNSESLSRFNEYSPASQPTTTPAQSSSVPNFISDSSAISAAEAQRLSPSQLELLERLSNSNVPGPALAMVVGSMLSSGGVGHSSGEPRLGESGQSEDSGGELPPPPAYEGGSS